MIPSLAIRGQLILASATTFILVGALSSSSALVVLGGVVISCFFSAYLWFFPAAILLRRRQVEISWSIPANELTGGALTVDQALPLRIGLRNHGSRGLRVLEIEIFCSSAIAPPTHLEALMKAGKQVNIEGILHAREAGYHMLHGVALRFGDLLGLFVLNAYFPSPLPLKVFPNTGNTSIPDKRQGGSSNTHQRQGIHQIRKRGLAGELRELREHQHGDPFKNIAWKATAKQRKLMVRDLENEVVLTHQFLLDIGGDMREGLAGKRKLDQGIELLAGLAHAAIESGDRVGIVTFDTRVYSHLAPGSGKHHYLQLLDRLVEVNGIVDDDLTDLTSSELVAAIANYLLRQESVDARIYRIPALDSQDWEHIQAGPQGQLFDLRVIERIIMSLLRVMSSSSERASSPSRSRHRDPFPWKTPSDLHSLSIANKMRRFARLRGIELPYQRFCGPTQRLKGLGDALRQASRGPRADMTVIISDFDSMVARADLKIIDIARARRNGRQVVALSPQSQPADSGAGDSRVPLGASMMVDDILDEERRIHLRKATLLMRRNGVPLLAVSRGESSASLAARIAASRARQRRGNLSHRVG